MNSAFAILCCIGLIMLAYYSIRDTELSIRNTELQQRINKAIEFIDKKVDPEPWSFYSGKAFYDLLQILENKEV